jgi:hypothetical protein
LVWNWRNDHARDRQIGSLQQKGIVQMSALSRFTRKLMAISAIAFLAVAMGSAFLAQEGDAKPPKRPPEDLNENAILSLLTPKTIFTTSDRYDGDLVTAATDLGDFPEGDGLAAADYICQYHAEEAGLKGNYMAVLSSSEVSASDRLSTSLGPYRLVTGTPVAENFAALFSTRAGATSSPELPPIHLITSVHRTEDGTSLLSPSPKFVWTGSAALGEMPVTGPGPTGSPQSDFSTCSDWTSAAADTDCGDFGGGGGGTCGIVGRATSRTTQWLDAERNGCDRLAQLYCAEQ